MKHWLLNRLRRDYIKGYEVDANDIHQMAGKIHDKVCRITRTTLTGEVVTFTAHLKFSHGEPYSEDYTPNDLCQLAPNGKWRQVNYTNIMRIEPIE